jgi:hypothetical protein
MLAKRYLYIDGNYKRRVASVGTISHVVTWLSRIAAALAW